MKKVLVTGADGFIGKNLVNTLLDKGIEVCAIVYPGNNIYKDCGNELLQVKCLDLNQVLNHVREFPTDIDVMYHFAWMGCGVTIGEGAVVRDSIIMNNVVIGAGCEINKAIIAENVQIGKGVKLGVGDEAENNTAPHIYNHGLVTVGEKSVIPDNVSVGKNTVIAGATTAADYENAYLASGKTLIKAEER